MPRMYDAPAQPAPALRPMVTSRVLTPESPVTLIHRGGPTVEDKWDGQKWRVPPGTWTVPYQVAEHLKARSVIPGSRNPHTGKTASQLAIAELDPPEKCQPFTEEQVRAWWSGAIVEALDRSAYESASQREAVVVDATDALRTVYSAGVDVEEAVEASQAAVAPGVGAVAAVAAEEQAAGGRRRR